ncbi:MAG: hypothetical protein WDN30_02780 [Pararobbsia sp.]
MRRSSGNSSKDTTLKHPSIEDYASGRALQGIASRHGIPIGEVFEKGGSDLALDLELDRFVRYQALAVSSAWRHSRLKPLFSVACAGYRWLSEKVDFRN